jgi:hypothetical protein
MGIKIRISKSVPNPSKPSEVFQHYYQHFFKWLFVYFNDSIRGLKGFKRNSRFLELNRLKNSMKGKEVFVFAGGPSINNLDPLKIKNYCETNNSSVFCVNYFLNSVFAANSKIDYLVLSDPRSFDMSVEESKLANSNLEKMDIKGVFVPEQLQDKLSKISTKKIFKFNDSETSHIFSKNINPTIPRSYVSMTAYKALAIAIFMGFDKIYICGFDNTYLKDLGCDENNRLFRKSVHFYTNEIQGKDQENHKRENKQMLQSRKNLQERNITDEILANSRLFSDLYRFRKHPVFNLDADSLTDAFPKDLSLDIYK